MNAVIDYIAEAERTRQGGFRIGIRERVELDTLIFGGESSAEQIADEVGISVRMVHRRRAHLRAKGYHLRVPDPEHTERKAAAGRRNLSRHRFVPGKQKKANQ